MGHEEACIVSLCGWRALELLPLNSSINGYVLQ
jgi:hypothetical protein